MGEPKTRQCSILARECCQSIDCFGQFLTGQFQCFPEQNQVSVVCDETAGRTQVNDGTSLRALVTKRVDVCNDIMAFFTFVLVGLFKIDRADRRSHFLDLYVGNFQAQFLLRFRKGNP